MWLPVSLPARQDLSLLPGVSLCEVISHTQSYDEYGDTTSFISFRQQWLFFIWEWIHSVKVSCHFGLYCIRIFSRDNDMPILNISLNKKGTSTLSQPRSVHSCQEMLHSVGFRLLYGCLGPAFMHRHYWGKLYLFRSCNIRLCDYYFSRYKKTGEKEHP